MHRLLKPSLKNHRGGLAKLDCIKSRTWQSSYFFHRGVEPSDSWQFALAIKMAWTGAFKGLTVFGVEDDTNTELLAVGSLNFDM